MIIIIGTVLLAYLLGSISTAIIVCKLFGILDPRQHGSCNPGATNVLRISGKIPAIITLFGDIIKGMLAIWIARSIKIESIELSCVMLSIFIGHLFPIFFRFQGGKGVATALGIITALSWTLGGLSVITWILVVAATRISSLGAIVTALTAPFY
ncbi:MAG TPA: glycerol-3-phosphate 1-O-acyltransferase PlsY, partial [Candidatus Scalindua sp.]|nr:glycerol-3-phosphate 1-O-acyltransferase PlsY [Candidatus Scalindua sp.]